MGWGYARKDAWGRWRLWRRWSLSRMELRWSTPDATPRTTAGISVDRCIKPVLHQSISDGRGSRIRTCDLKYPKLPRYRAALYPVVARVATMGGGPEQGRPRLSRESLAGKSRRQVSQDRLQGGQASARASCFGQSLAKNQKRPYPEIHGRSGSRPAGICARRKAAAIDLSTAFLSPGGAAQFFRNAQAVEPIEKSRFGREIPRKSKRIQGANFRVSAGKTAGAKTFQIPAKFPGRPAARRPFLRGFLLLRQRLRPSS